MTKPKNEPDRDNEEFYEAMPLTAGTFAPTYDHSSEQTKDHIKTGAEAKVTEEDARATAIVTLLLVLLIALAMGALFFRSVDTIKNSLPSQSDSSGSLEL